MAGKERSRAKLKKVLNQKGYANGEVPKDEEAHHVKPVAEGGKTTKKDIPIILKAKHKQINSKEENEAKYKC